MPSETPYTFDANAARMERVFVSLAGLIGAGKSTLATALANKLNLPVYYEPVADNVYLADFYKDMAKHAFAMQVYLLNKRFSQQQQIVWSNKGGVQDRTIYEDSVFAKMLRDSGLMEERDYQTYLDLFNHMANFMRKPNVIVYLDVSPEESLRRIRLRQRDVENGISLEYLQNLHKAYEEFINDIARVIPVIKVDYNSFRTTEEMADRIVKEYERIANIRYIDWHADSPVATDDSNSPVAGVSTNEAASSVSSPSNNSQNTIDKCEKPKDGVESTQPRVMLHPVSS